MFWKKQNGAKRTLLRRGGGGWIRTTEVVDNRFTVCPLWPLGNSSISTWSWWTDSNPRPADYKSAALPAELHQHTATNHIISHLKPFVKGFDKKIQEITRKILSFLCLFADGTQRRMLHPSTKIRVTGVFLSPRTM